MKKVAWSIYGLLIVSFNLFSLILAVNTSDGLAGAIISSVFAAFYLTGLYGYAYQKSIWKASGWRFLFWLNAVSATLRALLLLPSATTEVTIDIVFSILFSLPLLYALFKYSSSNFPIWEQSTYSNQKAHLANLIESASELIASVISSKPEGEEKTTVTLISNQNEFVVKIFKELNSETQSFSNSFADLESVAKFIEANTSVRVSDFAQIV